MPTRMRIATFNLENFDDKPGEFPTLDERITVMRPQLLRIDAEILCLQEVHGQETPGAPRRLLALEKFVAGTRYARYHVASTVTAWAEGSGGQVYDERNLVVMSQYPIIEARQYRHKFAPPPAYQIVTEKRPTGEVAQPDRITWERPILHVQIRLPGGQILHVINLHLKSKRPSDIKGQKLTPYTWASSSAWAEGFFISSMKRVGQALEVRMFIDTLFDADPNAMIVCAGDFNAELGEVPMEAIQGSVENTGNGGLANRVLIPCELSIPEPARYSLIHNGEGNMLDHLLVSRPLLAYYRGTEIHNEMLHDESIAFATDTKFPESDHAPVVAEFNLPD